MAFESALRYTAEENCCCLPPLEHYVPVVKSLEEIKVGLDAEQALCVVFSNAYDVRVRKESAACALKLFASFFEVDMEEVVKKSDLFEMRMWLRMLCCRLTIELSQDDYSHEFQRYWSSEKYDVLMSTSNRCV